MFSQETHHWQVLSPPGYPAHPAQELKQQAQIRLLVWVPSPPPVSAPDRQAQVWAQRPRAHSAALRHSGNLSQGEALEMTEIWSVLEARRQVHRRERTKEGASPLPVLRGVDLRETLERKRLHSGTDASSCFQKHVLNY